MQVVAPPATGKAAADLVRESDGGERRPRGRVGLRLEVAQRCLEPPQAVDFAVDQLAVPFVRPASELAEEADDEALARAVSVNRRAANALMTISVRIAGAEDVAVREPPENLRS